MRTAVIDTTKKMQKLKTIKRPNFAKILSRSETVVI